jgi:Protein of unknown function (DUF2490)
MTKTLTALLLFFSIATGWTQTRYEFWTRLNFNYWVNKKTGIGLELHHRRQSNYWSDQKNIFEESMLTIIRPWLYRKIGKDWILATSPLSFHAYRDILNQSGNTRDYIELRSTYGIQRNFKLKSITNRNRAWYEFRFTDIRGAKTIFQTRLRIQNTFLFPIKKINAHSMISFNLTNEFFISQRKTLIAFDHNRFFNGIQLKKKNYEINLGYQLSRHNSNSAPYSRHQVFLNTSIDL